MHRALDQPPLALDRLESHRVEIGNDQRAQLEKFEERLEQIGIGAADLEQGDILRADLRPAARLPPRRDELAENLGDKNTLGGSFDQDRLVGEEQVAACQRQILVKESRSGLGEAGEGLTQIIVDW